MQPTIIFDHVSKKFSRTYVSDSLRDTLLTPFKKLLGMNGNKSDKENKEFWALEDVSFEVKPGEVLGIIGSNGSGKTTTLKLLSRILRPDGGKIMVNGRIGALIELGAGFNPDLNGRENIFLNATILGMTRQEIEKKYDEIVEFADLHEFMDTPVKWYSTGMFARLGFSVAVHTDPEVLLVDEILSVGDVGFQSKCLEKMKSFRERGTTIVFVSHNMQSVASLCDRVILLGKGIVKKIGPTDETITYYMGKFKKESLQSLTTAVLQKGLLCNEAGSECSTFKSGQRVRVEIALKFNESLSNVQVTIGVYQKPRRLVSWINSASLTGQSLSVSKGQTLNLVVDFVLNFTSGDYEFNTSIYDPIKSKTIWEGIFAPFIMQKDMKSNGLVFMNPKLIDQKIITSE